MRASSANGCRPEAVHFFGLPKLFGPNKYNGKGSTMMRKLGVAVYGSGFTSASVLRRILCAVFVMSFVTSADGQVATGYYVTPSDVRLHVDYAQCVAKRDPAYATQVLDRFISEPYGKSIRDGFARFEGCKPGALFLVAHWLKHFSLQNFP
jgi:hypothetical protein